MKSYNICVNHPNRESLSFCHYCGKEYCASCLVEGPEYYYCQKPECLKAFEEGKKKFVNVSQAPGKLSLEDWVTVCLIDGFMPAQLARARLISEGIESRIVDSRPVAPDLPEGEEPEGSIELQVKAVDAHQAMNIVGFNL